MLKNAITAICLGLAAPASAQSFGTPAEGSILPGWREDGGRHVAGLSIRLASGWKTYWRAPGDGGIPPRFNWSGSSNLSSVEVRFPMPEVFEQHGMHPIGYDRDVVFPLIVVARDHSRPVMLSGEIEIGVCEEVCIPITLQVASELPTVGAPDSTIAREIANQPKQGGRFECRIEPIADGIRLRASAPVASAAVQTAVVEGGEDGTWISQPEVDRSSERFSAVVEMVPPSAQPFVLARSDVRLTLFGQNSAIEYQGC